MRFLFFPFIPSSLDRVLSSLQVFTFLLSWCQTKPPLMISEAPLCGFGESREVDNAEILFGSANDRPLPATWSTINPATSFPLGISHLDIRFGLKSLGSRTVRSHRLLFFDSLLAPSTTEEARLEWRSICRNTQFLHIIRSTKKTGTAKLPKQQTGKPLAYPRTKARRSSDLCACGSGTFLEANLFLANNIVCCYLYFWVRSVDLRSSSNEQTHRHHREENFLLTIVPFRRSLSLNFEESTSEGRIFVLYKLPPLSLFSHSPPFSRLNSINLITSETVYPSRYSYPKKSQRLIYFSVSIQSSRCSSHTLSPPWCSAPLPWLSPLRRGRTIAKQAHL